MQSNEVPTVRGGVDNEFSLPSSLALTTVGGKKRFRTKLLLNTPTASSRTKPRAVKRGFLVTSIVASVIRDFHPSFRIGR
jgi:hypothetical protein